MRPGSDTTLETGRRSMARPRRSSCQPGLTDLTVLTCYGCVDDSCPSLTLGGARIGALFRRPGASVTTTRPMRIPGRWREGFALDHHTLRSTFLGDDEFGHPMFETTRSEIGDLLYRLKYRTDESVVPDIIDAAVELLSAWRPGIEVVVPVPASRTRSVQPVLVLGSAMAKRLGIPFASECVSKSHEVPELKNATTSTSVPACWPAPTPLTGRTCRGGAFSCSTTSIARARR